jgi:hypothetical protein
VGSGIVGPVVATKPVPGVLGIVGSGMVGPVVATKPVPGVLGIVGSGIVGPAKTQVELVAITAARRAVRRFSRLEFMGVVLLWDRLNTGIVPQKLQTFYYKSNFFSESSAFSTVRARNPQEGETFCSYFSSCESKRDRK